MDALGLDAGIAGEGLAVAVAGLGVTVGRGVAAGTTLGPTVAIDELAQAVTKVMTKPRTR